MQSPNGVLTAETAELYFPTVDPMVMESPVVQDMIDDAMADVIETLGLDLSYGPGVPVTQEFQPDTGWNQMLRMIVPMEPGSTVTVVEGPTSRTMNVNEFTRYTNMLMSGGVYANYSWFDRGHNFGAQFVPPVTVTYTPRETVFRVIKQTMLELLKLRFVEQGMDQSSVGLGVVASITDDEQSVSFNNSTAGTNADSSAQVRRQQVLGALLLKMRGPRIG